MTTYPGNNYPMAPVVNQPASFQQNPGQPMQPGFTYPNANMPVVHQPGASMQYQCQGVQFPMAAPTNVWMPIPLEELNAGFEYLAPLDGFLIHQFLEVMEIITGYETNNRYVVKNTQGQIIYMVYEDSKCCDRACCGPMRAFDIKIMDCRGVEVIHLSRETNCQCCLCPCCLQEMNVVSPVIQLNGVVKQQWSFCEPKLRIKTNGETTDLKLDGPACICCSDAVFKLSDASGRLIGNITKKWMGCFVESYTDADNYELSFPQLLSSQQKIMLMATTLLLDFMYFEQSKKNR